MSENNITITNQDGLEFLNSLKNNSVDLILTDPPYIISKESGMNKFEKEVKQIEDSGEMKKTEEEWLEFKKTKTFKTTKHEEEAKQNYLKYGNRSGKKYGFKTDYGEWDKDFTIEKLSEFLKLYYKKLRKGGTCIIFFDIWKLETLKRLMEQIKKGKKKWIGFKQIRFVEWIKTNPVPLNQSTNYLTNCREVALLGVKGGKPTFNGKYDNAIYQFPLQGGKNRFHPTQKSLPLFEALIEKHSNEGDLVVDTFLGGGTTALACKNTNRRFKGCEISKEYYDKVIELIEK